MFDFSSGVRRNKSGVTGLMEAVPGDRGLWPMVDLHSRSHPLDKLYALWDLIDMDADWDALGKSDPGADWIYRQRASGKTTA